MKFLTPVLIILVAISSCSGKKKRPENLAPEAHMITAEEVLQTSNYTYVRASEDGNEYWMAIVSTDVKKGETYYWANGQEMKDFTSRELNRRFASIYFVDKFSDKVITKDPNDDISVLSRAGKPQTKEKEGISVPKVEGGLTIAELYSQKENYKGKTVKVRGEVVKFSPDIMKKNWVHIQDGSRQGNFYDLAVTTKDTVKVGDIVTFSGTVSVNKDFGAGYRYELIMEDAKPIK